MTIGKDAIEIYQGEDVDLDFTISPVEDITAWTVSLSVGVRGGAAAITKTGTITDGPNGQFQFALVEADTEVAAGNYQYDVWKTNAGAERVLAAGHFIIRNPVRETA